MNENNSERAFSVACFLGSLLLAATIQVFIGITIPMYDSLFLLSDFFFRRRFGKNEKRSNIRGNRCLGYIHHGHNIQTTAGSRTDRSVHTGILKGYFMFSDCCRTILIGIVSRIYGRDASRLTSIEPSACDYDVVLQLTRDNEIRCI